MRQTLLACSPDYPKKLLALPRPPASVRVEGAIGEQLGTPAVAIVGTRAADEDGEAFAFELGRACAAAGLVVVSGGARGIDRAAHEGALDGGGFTVVVLGSGLDAAYPRAHRPLFARVVASGGLLLTEGADADPPTRSRLLSRNRLIAALAETTVVVQAPAKSGALTTARHAKALGRRLFAVPFSPWDPRGYGCLELIRGGAGICTRPQDVLLVFPLSGGHRVQPGAPQVENPGIPAGLSHEESALFAALRRRPATADELATRTKLGVGQVQVGLLSLRLRDLVVERSGGRYAAVGNAR